MAHYNIKSGYSMRLSGVGEGWGEITLKNYKQKNKTKEIPMINRKQKKK